MHLHNNLLISDDSYVKINGIKINSGKKSEEINKLLYGKVYGVKTIRQWDMKKNMKLILQF